MEVWFADHTTQELCTQLGKLQARWGRVDGERVARRLLQLRAAPTLEAMMRLPGNCRPSPAADGTWLIDVDGVARLRLRPGGPGTDDKALTTAQITVVAISDHQSRREEP